MDRGVEYPGGTFPLGKGSRARSFERQRPGSLRRWAAEGPPVQLIYGTEAGELVTPPVRRRGPDPVSGFLPAALSRCADRDEPFTASCAAKPRERLFAVVYRELSSTAAAIALQARYQSRASQRPVAFERRGSTQRRTTLTTEKHRPPATRSFRRNCSTANALGHLTMPCRTA